MTFELPAFTNVVANYCNLNRFPQKLRCTQPVFIKHKHKTGFHSPELHMIIILIPNLMRTKMQHIFRNRNSK